MVSHPPQLRERPKTTVAVVAFHSFHATILIARAGYFNDPLSVAPFPPEFLAPFVIFVV